MDRLSIDSKSEIIENFEEVFPQMDFKDASYSAYFQNKRESDDWNLEVRVISKILGHLWEYC